MSKNHLGTLKGLHSLVFLKNSLKTPGNPCALHKNLVYVMHPRRKLEAPRGAKGSPKRLGGGGKKVLVVPLGAERYGYTEVQK